MFGTKPACNQVQATSLITSAPQETIRASSETPEMRGKAIASGPYGVSELTTPSFAKIRNEVSTVPHAQARYSSLPSLEVLHPDEGSRSSGPLCAAFCAAFVSAPIWLARKSV